jgi:hypothetical protein
VPFCFWLFAPANQKIYEDGKNIVYQKIYSALIESQVNAWHHSTDSRIFCNLEDAEFAFLND